MTCFTLQCFYKSPRSLHSPFTWVSMADRSLSASPPHDAEKGQQHEEGETFELDSEISNESDEVSLMVVDEEKLAQALQAAGVTIKVQPVCFTAVLLLYDRSPSECIGCNPRCPIFALCLKHARCCTARTVQTTEHTVKSVREPLLCKSSETHIRNLQHTTHPRVL